MASQVMLLWRFGDLYCNRNPLLPLRRWRPYRSLMPQCGLTASVGAGRYPVACHEKMSTTLSAVPGFSTSFVAIPLASWDAYFEKAVKIKGHSDLHRRTKAAKSYTGAAANSRKDRKTLYKKARKPLVFKHLPEWTRKPGK